MKKTFRWAVIGLISLLAILSIASGIAWYYKPEITAAIHQRLRENINGEFNIDDVRISIFDDFPNISVTLQGVFLRGPQFATYKKEFFTAKKVLLNVNLFKLLLKEVHVKSVKIIHGDIFVFRSRKGYTNIDFLKTKKPADIDSVGNKPVLFSVQEIIFDDVAIAYQDSSKGKAFVVKMVSGKNMITETDSSRQLSYHGDVDFGKLQFNEAKGSYLLGKSSEVNIRCEYIQGHHQLNILPSDLKFKESTIGLSGAFSFVPQGKFSLHFDSENLNYSEGLSLLPESLGKKLDKYKVEAPFAINVGLEGTLAPGDEPAVDIAFSTNHAPITAGKFKTSHVSLKGSFSNHLDNLKAHDDKNSGINISSFEGNYEGFPMNIQASFKNLEDPDVDLNISIDADAKPLQHELDSTIYRIEGGRFHTQMTYQGKLKEYLNPDKNRLDGKLAGKTDIKDAKFLWATKGIELDEINASIAFTESKFQIENVSLKFNKSPVVIKGTVVGFVPFFSQPSQKGIVKLQIFSPDLNFTPQVTKVHKKEVRTPQGQGKKLISDLIDKLYSKLEFELVLNVQQFRYKKFKATEITGNIALSNNQLQANPVKMRLAGGNVQVVFGMYNLNRQINPISIRGVVQQADIGDFFYAFNNFNQHTISYEHLSGKISAKVNLRASLDDDFNLLMPALDGQIDLTVRRGKLRNFPPLEKLSNFLFKKRDFSDVEFAEINSTFTMHATELTISRMEVQSSVISLFLEGRYSLKDSTDLSIQLPLSNLKKRDQHYKPKNVGVDSKVGPSVFLRARRDESGNIGISYDPFKKFRKGKGH